MKRARNDAAHEYYRSFRDKSFVVQTEVNFLEKDTNVTSIMSGICELVQHKIRVVLVFGETEKIEQELQQRFDAKLHPETRRLIVPERSLKLVQEYRRQTSDAIADLCGQYNIPFSLLSSSVIQAERRVRHESTGSVRGVDRERIETTLEEGRLAVIGFGGEDQRNQFLHVPSVPLAAEVAVELHAQKLILLAKEGGIAVPTPRNGKHLMSFADLEQLLCLLQKRDDRNEPILTGDIIPKVHASIRAVAGGVEQVHIVSEEKLLEEILTRTGVGTMIERHQTHQVDFAHEDDLDGICALHREVQAYKTPGGIPFIKPLSRPELQNLLPHTLLLKHLGIVIGKLHATQVLDEQGTVLIGGLAIGEDHQNSQQGQLLLSESLARLRGRGYQRAVAITSSGHAKRLFEKNGGAVSNRSGWELTILEAAQQRYQPSERQDVSLYEFKLMEESAAD